VPRFHDQDAHGHGPVQPGLPGVLLEEAPLPSEVVLDGGILARRLREALAAKRAMLLERDETCTPEEWRVVCATLAPPQAHLGRVPGSPARSMGAMQAARDCFPGLPATTALRRFRETQALPHVATIVAEFRAMELLDVQEQRGMVREALHATIVRGASALHRLDPEAAPNEWARVSACVTAACKVLADMDALALRAEEVAAVTSKPAAEQDDGDAARALAEKVGRVAADLRARRGETAGA
jgi:hypothetical protein